MLMAARKLQGIGLVLLVLLLAMTFYPMSLKVASKRSELARVERDIRSSRENIRYLETELGARASLRQLERWNAESFAYSAPTAAQYLEGERQLANLGSFAGADRERLAVVAPVQAATAMVVSVDGNPVASDSETATSSILASQIKAAAATVDVQSAAKPQTRVVVAAKPTARDRYAERARMIDNLLEKDSPVSKTAAAVTKRAEASAAKKPAAPAAKKASAPSASSRLANAVASVPAGKKQAANATPARATPARSTPARTATTRTAQAKKPETKKAEPRRAEAKKPDAKKTAVASRNATPAKAEPKKSSPRKVASADRPRSSNQP